MARTEDITEAAGILSILVIRERIRTISTADGARIRKLVIIGVRGVVMRPAATPGRRAAAEGQAGAEAHPLPAARRFHTPWWQDTVVVVPRTVAVVRTAAAIIVNCGASLELRE